MRLIVVVVSFRSVWVPPVPLHPLTKGPPVQAYNEAQVTVAGGGGGRYPRSTRLERGGRLRPAIHYIVGLFHAPWEVEGLFKAKSRNEVGAHLAHIACAYCLHTLLRSAPKPL